VPRRKTTKKEVEAMGCRFIEYRGEGKHQPEEFHPQAQVIFILMCDGATV